MRASNIDWKAVFSCMKGGNKSGEGTLVTVAAHFLYSSFFSLRVKANYKL